MDQNQEELQFKWLVESKNQHKHTCAYLSIYTK